MIDYRTTGALHGTQAPGWVSPFVQRVGNETSEDRRVALVTWLAGEQELTIDLLLAEFPCAAECVEEEDDANAPLSLKDALGRLSTVGW